jgi:hypothetical protein
MMGRLIIAVAVVLCGCASSPQPKRSVTTPSTPTPSATSRAATAFDPEAPARVETPTFALELSSDANASTAQLGRVTLTIEGRGPFHVNLDYPLRVQLGGSSAARLEKAELGPSDAAELGEARARFDADVRWNAPGQHWLAARVLFAVCTPDACVPSEQTLAVKLQVQ